MTLALTLVGAPLPEGIEQAAADICGVMDLGVMEARELAPGVAVDLILDGEADRSTADVMAVLREALPEVDLALQPAEGRKKKLLIADMDSTMVVGETIDELADALGKKDSVAAITARAMRGELDFEAALDERVGMLAGLDATEIDRVAAQLTYSEGARDFISAMKATGATCMLVSGGFDRVTGVVREALGFDRDIANHLEVGEDGKLTGTARKPIVDSGTKLSTLTTLADILKLQPADTLAIGDGANDRPMIEAAGMGIAYRAKPTLKEATPFWIDHTDLTTALYFQGYTEAEIRAASAA